VGRNYSWW